MGISVLFSNIGQFIVNFSFLPLVDSIGDMGTFLFYFFISIIGVCYIMVYVVETKETEPAAILSALLNRSFFSALDHFKRGDFFYT